jgi:hypothetical protein
MALYPNPPSAFMSQYHSYGLIGIVGQNPSQPNFELQFSSSATDSQKTFVETQAQTFDWIPYVPAPGPNVLGFTNTVMSDDTIPAQAQMGLAAWYPQLQMFINNSSVIKSGWANLVLTFESTWLTSQVQTSVLAYALEFNIPLV